MKATTIAAIASALFVLAMTSARRPASAKWREVASILGIGLGLALGFYVLSWRWVWPPANGLDRLLTIVVPAVMCIELIVGLLGAQRWVAWMLRFRLAAAIPRILLHGSVYLSGSDAVWTLSQAGAVLATSGGLLAGLWASLSRLSHRSPGILIPLSLAMAIQCAGITVMMSGYIKGGAATFPLTAALVGTTLAFLWTAKRTAPKTPAAPAFLAPSFLAPAAIIGAGVVGLMGTLLIGRFFGRLSTGYALMILIAPL